MMDSEEPRRSNRHLLVLFVVLAMEERAGNMGHPGEAEVGPGGGC